MKYAYHLHPEADKDLSNAYAWYENNKLGLGQKFIDAVLEKIETIAAWPELYGSKRKGY